MKRLITGLIVTFSLISVTSLTYLSQLPDASKSPLINNPFSISEASAAVTPTAGEIALTWPQANTSDQVAHTFTATLPGMSVNDYYLFWQVGDGNYVIMPNTSDGTAKQAVINFASWHWRGDGPYTVNFIAQDLRAQEFARRTVNFSREWTATGPIWKATHGNFFAQSVATVGKPIANQVANSNVPVVTPVPTANVTAPSPTPVAKTVSPPPQVGKSFYAAPNTLTAYVDSLSPNASMYTEFKRASQTPQAIWLGEWTPNVEATVKDTVDKATQSNAIASFVLYNVPYRDCGQYSAGGLPASQYLTWIDQVARGIGNRQAMIVLEPDALPGANCLSESAKSERYSLIKNAVGILKQKSGADVYIDIGHPTWLGVDDAVSRLQQTGIEQANGFAINVSNFAPLDTNIAYGDQISSKLGGKHYIVDTSRNGAGSADGNWCNPSGKKLGVPSTFNTGHTNIDAYLWIKHPGESDGTCNGGPSAGSFWPDYLLRLF